MHVEDIKAFLHHWASLMFTKSFVWIQIVLKVIELLVQQELGLINRSMAKVNEDKSSAAHLSATLDIFSRCLSNCNCQKVIWKHSGEPSPVSRNYKHVSDAIFRSLLTCSCSSSSVGCLASGAGMWVGLCVRTSFCRPYTDWGAKKVRGQTQMTNKEPSHKSWQSIKHSRVSGRPPLPFWFYEGFSFSTISWCRLLWCSHIQAVRGPRREAENRKRLYISAESDSFSPNLEFRHHYRRSLSRELLLMDVKPVGLSGTTPQLLLRYRRNLQVLAKQIKQQQFFFWPHKFCVIKEAVQSRRVKQAK